MGVIPLIASVFFFFLPETQGKKLHDEADKKENELEEVDVKLIS